MIQIEGAPETLTRDQVCKAIEALGFDVDQVNEISISPEFVEAKIFTRPLHLVRRYTDEAIDVPTSHTVIYALR